jgi:hypothetical protein
MTAAEHSARHYARHRKSINRKRRAAYKQATGNGGRRLSPGRNPASADLIMTPPEVAQHIVDSFAPRGRLLDPCRGAGAFYDALRRHSDDVAWCELAEGRDFLDHHEPYDWIVTNPPWSKFLPFLKHAMTLANDIVFLATATHFVTRARLRVIAAAGFGIVRIMPIDNPPPPWPGGGFQLAAVHIRKGATSLFG